MEKKIDYNKLSAQVHNNALQHGFWQDQTSDEHFLCLVVAELMEAVEAHRNDRHAELELFERMLAEAVNEHESATESERYAYWFECYVKDSIGDELADAVIRLLDLAGAHEYEINSRMRQPIRWELRCREQSFTENIWDVVCMLTMRILISQRTRVVFVLRMIMVLAERMGVELEKHIIYKVKYNATRPYKHGKAY